MKKILLVLSLTLSLFVKAQEVKKEGLEIYWVLASQICTESGTPQGDERTIDRVILQEKYNMITIAKRDTSRFEQYLITKAWNDKDGAYVYDFNLDNISGQLRIYYFKSGKVRCFLKRNNYTYDYPWYSIKDSTFNVELVIGRIEEL